MARPVMSTLMDDLAMDIHNYLLEKSTRFQGKNLVLIPITEVVKNLVATIELYRDVFTL